MDKAKAIEALFNYRMQQAEETLSDAEFMLKNNRNPRSIVNRAYYSMFYALLALYLKTNTRVKTSKHKGIIILFETEFIQKQKIAEQYSDILHKTYMARLQGDYKAPVQIKFEDTKLYVNHAKEFLKAIKNYLNNF